MSAVSPEDARLLCDAMLGTLATHLRMCGYDVADALDRDAEADDEVLVVAREEGRTVVTRDADRAAQAADAVLLTSSGIDDQLRGLAAVGFELDLGEPTRCSRCNGRLAREPLGRRAVAAGRAVRFRAPLIPSTTDTTGPVTILDDGRRFESISR